MSKSTHTIFYQDMWGLGLQALQFLLRQNDQTRLEDQLQVSLQKIVDKAINTKETIEFDDFKKVLHPIFRQLELLIYFNDELTFEECTFYQTLLQIVEKMVQPDPLERIRTPLLMKELENLAECYNHPLLLKAIDLGIMYPTVKRIDDYVTANINTWRERLDSGQDKHIFLHKKETQLFHHINVGYEGLSGEAPKMGENSKPVLRVLATIKLIGRGSYCDASETHDWLTAGRTFAKILLKSATLSYRDSNHPKTSLEDMNLRMMKVWRALDSRKGIVPLPIMSSQFLEQYVTGQFETRFFYIMPKYSRTLHDILKSESTVHLHDVISKMRDIAAGLMSLKQSNVVHMDIKPDNLFIDEDDSLLISDFNCSYMKDEYVQGIKEKKKFTACKSYWSPELWLREGDASDYSRIEADPFSRDMLAAGLSMLQYAIKGINEGDSYKMISQGLAKKYKEVMYDGDPDIKEEDDRVELDKEINAHSDHLALTLENAIRTKYSGNQGASTWVKLVRMIFLMIRPDPYFRLSPEELLDLVKSELK